MPRKVRLRFFVRFLFGLLLRTGTESGIIEKADCMRLKRQKGVSIWHYAHGKTFLWNRPGTCP